MGTEALMAHARRAVVMVYSVLNATKFVVHVSVDADCHRGRRRVVRRVGGSACL